MALDLGKTSLQISQMTKDLQVQQSTKLLRLNNALSITETFDIESYDQMRSKSIQTLAWPRAPILKGPPSERYSTPTIPDDFCVLAVDGSHIDVDRHLPARCFLINIGTCTLTYGSQPNAVLTNHPRLYAHNNDLFIRDKNAKHRQQSIQGAVLSAKRAVEEVRGLVEAIQRVPPELPTLALMDGTLIMFIDRAYQDFVINELLVDGFVAALDDLKKLAMDRPLAVASYISLPGHSEFTAAVRIRACPYEVSDCATHCGKFLPGSRPCDEAAEGIQDRDIFEKLLRKGQRSVVFDSTNSLVANYYDAHGVSFFYINSGEEIGRVEIPSWIAQNEAMLNLTHALINDQCNRGPGYPVSLMEAHEQAIITTSDRRYFIEMVEESLENHHMSVFTSEKNRSKRLRWI